MGRDLSKKTDGAGFVQKDGWGGICPKRRMGRDLSKKTDESGFAQKTDESGFD